MATSSNRRLRKGPAVALALVTASAAGCQTMLIRQMQAAPIENRLFLKGYKAGDYALYEAMDGAMQVKLEIADVKPGAVEVHLSWPKAPVRVGFMTHLVRRMFLNQKGEVLNAFIEDRRGGGRHPLLVAAPGDPNYIGDIKEVDFEKGQAVRTPAGTFNVDKVLIFTMDLRNPVISQQVTTALFLDPSVRFGLVRRVDVYESRLPAFELYQKALSLAPVPDSVTTLYDFILRHVEGAKPWEMNLLATR